MCRKLVLGVGIAWALILCSSAAAAPPNASCAGCTPPLVKIGGATGVTQVTPTVNLVFWGSHWNDPKYIGHTAVMNAASNLFFKLSNNTGAAATYNNILKQYLGKYYVPFYGGTWVDTSDPPASLQSADFAAEAVKAITNVPLFGGGQNAQFIIFPEEKTVVAGRPVRVTVSFAGEPDPNFCAFHDYRTGTAKGTVVYDVEPWTGSLDGCVNKYGNGTTAQEKLVNSMTTVATHEYAEAATDPFWNGATTKGWQTNQPGQLFEIGDLCAYQGVTLAGVGSVQYLWSNAARGGAGACTSG